ncbi:MAG: hypothetical protein WCK01_00595 [Candidatus Uhrbacteria bacterium]
MRNLFTAVMAMVVCVVLGFTGSASADACHADSPHTLTRDVMACGVGGVSCEQSCACAPGYSADGSLPNGDPNCTRNPPSYGAYSDPLCALGATRGRDGQCGCPESLGARRHRVLTIVSRAYATSIADRIEGNIPRSGRVVALQVCIDPLATGTSTGSLPEVVVSAGDRALRLLCAAPEAATDEELMQACRETRVIIDSFRAASPGSVTIHYGDRTYTIQQFVDELLVPKFGEIEGRLTALEGRVGALEAHDVEQDEAIAALEAGDHSVTTPDGASSFTLTLGLIGELGIPTYGPMTLSGDATATGLFRPGTSSMDVYLRLRGGVATTAFSRTSVHLAGAAGLSFYLGENRRGLTLAVGFQAEDLLVLGPDDPSALQGDTIGFEAGGELNLGIPVTDSIHFEIGLGLGYSERYDVQNGTIVTFPGLYVAPHVGLTVQLF